MLRKGVVATLIVMGTGCTEPRLVARDGAARIPRDGGTQVRGDSATQAPLDGGFDGATVDARVASDAQVNPEMDIPTDTLGTCERLCGTLAQCACTGEPLCEGEDCVANCLKSHEKYTEPDCLSSLNTWITCVQKSPCTTLNSLNMDLAYMSPPDATDCIEEAVSVHCGDLAKEACYRRGCDPIADCIAIDGSPQCACPSGFLSVPSTTPGVRCEDVDECAIPGTCGMGATCINTFGGHECICAAGYALDASGACIPWTECVTGKSWTFNLLIEGDGRGRVEVQTNRCTHLCTERECRLPVSSQEQLTIRALPAPYSLAAPGVPNNCGLDAHGSGTCAVGNDQSTTSVAFYSAHNIAFVSSSVHSGNMAGLDGADTICAERAREAGLTGNRWVALLDTKDSDGSRKVETLRGWVRTDSMPLLDRYGSHLMFPLNLDEYGHAIPKGERVWAGNAYEDSATCSDWTSDAPDEIAMVGDPERVDSYFTGRDRVGCDTLAHLYCFRADAALRLPDVAPFPGRVAFATSEKFVPGAPGEDVLARADALCQREACERGLTGIHGTSKCGVSSASSRNFRALLGTSSQAALSRLSSIAGPWTNELRLPWIPAGGDLAEGPFINSPIAGYQGSRPQWAYVGFDVDPHLPADETCSDWSNAGAAGGNAMNLGQPTREIAAISCSGAALLCVEE